MKGSGRGVMYYTGAFWIVAIIVLLIILCFAWGCTDWNAKSCRKRDFDKKLKDKDDDRFDQKSFRQEDW